MTKKIRLYVLMGQSENNKFLIISRQLPSNVITRIFLGYL